MNKKSRFLKTVSLLALLLAGFSMSANSLFTGREGGVKHELLADDGNSDIAGDIDNDGRVNIADVTQLIDAILSGEVNLACDVDQDGVVDIGDVTCLIDIILKHRTQTEAPEINVSIDKEYVIVEATGKGELTLYKDGVEVENPYSNPRGLESASHTFTATAWESGKDVSDETTLEVDVPAMNMSQFGYYGINYPDQMANIKIQDRNTNSEFPQLRFIHVSDSHGTGIGVADDLLKNCAAEFLAHTGDLVKDNFWHDFSVLLSRFIASPKPCYITLGNHDCYKSSFSNANGSGNDSIENWIEALTRRYNKFYVNPATSEPWIDAQEVADGNTWYHVDIEKGGAKYRCLFLDEADGGCYWSANPTGWTVRTKLRVAQRDWFVRQLQEAAAGGYHVIIFIHAPIGNVGTPVSGWFDTNGQTVEHVKTMLKGIVKAFMTGGTYSYDKNQTYLRDEYNKAYSCTFDTPGTFVGWFCGHSHFDCYGRLMAHDSDEDSSLDFSDQFMCCTGRPYTNSGDASDGFVKPDKSEPHVKYVTVDYEQRKVTVMNVGFQTLKSGGKRDVFTYSY